MRVKDYYINNEKILNPTEIVQISDLHTSELTPSKKYEDILKAVDEKQVDYILVLGDIIHDAMRIDKRLVPFFSELSSLAKKRLLVIKGNHDTLTLDKETSGKWKHFSSKDFFDKLSQIDAVSILENQQIYFSEDNISFLGLDFDGYKHYEVERESEEDFIKTVNGLNINIDPKHYNICLSHSPRNIMDKDVISKTQLAYSLDLILSGHMHNGVTPYWMEPAFNLLFKILKNDYPNTKGIFDPLESNSLFPTFTRGMISDEYTTGIIGSPITCLAETSGLKAKIINSRLFIPSTVTKIHLNKLASVKQPSSITKGVLDRQYSFKSVY